MSVMDVLSFKPQKMIYTTVLNDVNVVLLIMITCLVYLLIIVSKSLSENNI